MTYERLVHQILPYEIHMYHADIFGHRERGPILHGAYYSMDEREQAWDLLDHSSKVIRFEKSTNLKELDEKQSRLEKQGLDDKGHNKLAEPAMPDIPPDMDVITYARPITAEELELANKAFIAAFVARHLKDIEDALLLPIAEKTREIL
jgi:hypothetical protein